MAKELVAVVVVEAEREATSRLGPALVVEESQACICKVVKTHPVFSKDCYRESVTGGRWCFVGVID